MYKHSRSTIQLCKTTITKTLVNLTLDQMVFYACVILGRVCLCIILSECCSIKSFSRTLPSCHDVIRRCLSILSAAIGILYAADEAWLLRQWRTI